MAAVGRENRDHHQRAAKIMKCVFRFPTKVAGAQLDAGRRDSRGTASGGHTISCNSILPANNNTNSATANRRRPPVGETAKQLPLSQALGRCLLCCLLFLLSPSILLAVASSGSGSSSSSSPSSSTTNAPAPIWTPANYLVSPGGNEKEINGEVAAEQQARLGLLAAVGADQHGVRVSRQVVAVAAARPLELVKGKQEAGSRTGPVSDGDKNASGRLEETVEQASDSSVETSADDKPQLEPANGGQYEDERGDDDDSQPYLVVASSRLYTDWVRQLESDRTGGGEPERQEEASEMDAFDLMPTVALLPAVAANSPPEEEPDESQETAPVAKRSDLRLSPRIDLGATTSSSATTTTATSDTSTETNKPGGKVQDFNPPLPRRLQPAPNSIELSVNLTDSLKSTNLKTSRADLADGDVLAEKGYCLGLKHSSSMFEWNCIKLMEANHLVTALDPKPTTLRLTMVNIETLPASSLQPFRESLRDFSVETAPRLQTIEGNTFANLTRLRAVYIIQAPRLMSFDLAITGRQPDLAIIRIQQTGLRTWPDLSEFQQQRLLTSIDLDNNRIESFGKRPINIRAEVVNLEFNLITSIDEHVFNGSEIGALSLSGNRQLVFIHENAFANLKNLIKLDLSGTSLSQLPSVGLHQLRHLKVQDNFALKQIPSIFVFPMLEEAQMTYSFHCCSFRYPKTHDPSAYEEHIKLQNEINAVCSKRQDSAAVDSRGWLQETGNRRLEGAWARIAGTASGLVNLVKRSLGGGERVSVAAAPTVEHELSSGASVGTTTASSDFEGSFFDMDRQQQQPLPPPLPPPPQLVGSTESAASSTTQRPNSATRPTNATSGGGDPSSDGASLKKQWLLQNIECGELVQKQTDYQNIICTPEPDAFNPCEDIMGYPVLRVAVWLVVACSMFGNMSVIVVLLTIFRRLSVPKFLQLNLAIGDLFMGVYLAMLAGADIATVGTYFNYALDWQHGLGCQLAGASSLFASQLSIFTLIVITFERYYTITYSIDLNMRLQLGWAARIMLIGWCYAFASAMLPIFANINSYSKTSICLPMRTIYQSDKIFILVLLIVDSCAFLIIFICYLRMYLLILKQKTEASLKERTVAMRMALLVLTDFACWAPIIFFSSTAVFGMPLISVTNSKILIVFFYPLNSMANPFLYVLSTRQYRRDLNYVISRWRHWRKNLFKSDDKKDFSNSNFIIPYGGGGGGAMAGKYPNLPMNTANLTAVAAMTGVADHLPGYRISIDEQNKQRLEMAERGGQQVELIKLSHDQNDCVGSRACRRADNAVGQLVSKTVGHRGRGCKHRHSNKHRRNHHPHNAHNNNQEGNDKHTSIANRSQNNQPPNAQYIIRHQILPNKCSLAGANHALTMGRSLRMITFENGQTNGPSTSKPTRVRLEDDPNPQQKQQQQQQQKMRCNTVKLGFVIDSNDNSSSLDQVQDATAINMNETRLSNLNSDEEVRNMQRETEQGQSGNKTATSDEVNLQQPQLGTTQRAIRKICVCSTDYKRRRSTNWTTKLNIRTREGVKQTKSTAKSTSATITTDANSTTNSLTNSSQTGGAKSLNEPDIETTATLETTTTTTTTATITTGNSDDNQSGTPSALGLESVDVGSNDDDTRQDRSCHHHRRHNHHHHHHHRHGHHNHRHRDGHRSRNQCGSRSHYGETGARCTDIVNGPPAKTVLERITESSNAQRSTTPIDQGHREHSDHHQHHHHHHHHHHHGHRNRHHHHHRCRDHQKRARCVVEENEETVQSGQQQHEVHIQLDD